MPDYLCSFCGHRSSTDFFSRNSVYICRNCVIDFYKHGIEGYMQEQPAPSQYYVTLTNLEARYLVLKYGLAGNEPMNKTDLARRFEKLGGEKFIEQFEKHLVETLCSIDTRLRPENFKSTPLDLSSLDQEILKAIETDLDLICQEKPDGRIHECSLCGFRMYVKEAGNLCQNCVTEIAQQAKKFRGQTD